MKASNYLIAPLALLLLAGAFSCGSEAGKGSDQKAGGVEANKGPLPVRSGPIPGKPWTSPTGIEFVYIRPGTFMMGSPVTEQSRKSDETQHNVTLTKGYWLGKYEVTQAQWQVVMGSNPSHFKGVNLPVESVSWEDCQEFINRLCQMEGAPQGTYRLPTEAEWEYACRAGTTGPYAGGSDDSGLYISTHSVGQHKPNAQDLYDMHGNVLEWCADWYGDYPSGSVTDPAGPDSGSRRVGRGGGWSDGTEGRRSAIRKGIDPDKRYPNWGFRLLRIDSPFPNVR